MSAPRVEPVRNSWMARPSAARPEPEAAALLVNAAAEVFVSENLERDVYHDLIKSRASCAN